MRARFLVEPKRHEPEMITVTAVLDQLVVVDTVTGRHQRALGGIERLLTMPSLVKPVRLRLDPIYDPRRQYARFRQLAGESP